MVFSELVISSQLMTSYIIVQMGNLKNVKEKIGTFTSHAGLHTIESTV
jgi:hypothetical protein